ncbi:MAG: SUF system Fe-S cluster assembly regulator [Exilibacterium sp.]
MLKIGRLADYGLLIAHYLEQRAEQVTTEEIARGTFIPVATARKLLKYLVDGGIVASRRGLRGGYQLARPGPEISIADVIQAVEGPIALTECNRGSGNCELEPTCALRDSWSFINDLVTDRLKTFTLADIASDMRHPPAAAQVQVVQAK